MLFALLGTREGFHHFTFRRETIWTDVSDLCGFERHVAVLGDEGDLELGVVPYSERNCKRLGDASVLWARLESPSSRAALARLSPAPTLVTQEGAGSKGVALWALQEPLSPRWAAQANRRLAHALGTCKKYAEASFRFHPPGTVLRAHRKRPALVTEAWGDGIYSARDVVGELAEPPEPFDWRKAA